ncbi:hypothetical protein QJD27_000890 [Salmonella enterica]|nr:hypothetical protein [Salmonella enterica]ELD8010216.1 hypothetical protein [Salmonella enterica]
MMEAVFVLFSKLLLAFGFLFSDKVDTLGVFYCIGGFLGLTAIVLIMFVLFVALRQFIHNFKVKRSYEYKIGKMLSDIIDNNAEK